MENITKVKPASYSVLMPFKFGYVFAAIPARSENEVNSLLMHTFLFT